MNNTPRRPWLASFRRTIHATAVSIRFLMQSEGGDTFIVVESENVLASAGDGLPSGRLRPVQTATG